MKERILKKFEDEIAALDKELKTELPREIKRARELGDLRENAEYQAAKERQRLVESRISLLQKRVSEIQLMNLDRIPKDRVGFGSTVTLLEDNGHTVVYQLVMPEDANVERGLFPALHRSAARCSTRKRATKSWSTRPTARSAASRSPSSSPYDD